jgi:hypothetical protein
VCQAIQRNILRNSPLKIVFVLFVLAYPFALANGMFLKHFYGNVAPRQTLFLAFYTTYRKVAHQTLMEAKEQRQNGNK